MLIMRLLSILFFAAVFTASSASWGDSTTGNLHWGDSIELEGYRLEVADFSKEDTPAPMVLLKLYNRDGLITQRTLSQGQNFSLDDEIMAAVDAISVPDHSEGNDQPEAKVRLVLKAIPEIILHLTSSKDSYEPGEEIRLGLTVENQGTVDAEGIRINISSVPELLARDYGISELKAGGVGVLADTDAENAIILWAPYSQGLKEFKIRARAEYSDESSKGHESDGYGAFSVTDQLRLHKQVQETMKLGTSYPVILTLRNPGENSGSADLSDGLPDGFSSSSSLKWKVEVEPGKTQTVSYDMKPEGQGGDFILPPAVARYDLGGEAFESRSESPSVNVTGPRLNVEKRISSSKVRPGEAVVVSIDVKNEGNQTVKASLNESLPAFAKLVGGKTRISQILKPGDIASLSYSISWNRPGDYVIPAASIS
ncbi:MAG TPA: hypothetical protein VN455_10110, partial [Methanotrichaceae archaeon]|nr:hypothetical protein [Methanotrichaceae archaeon]